MNIVERGLKAQDAENLWVMLSMVSIEKLPKQPGVAGAVYELRESLNEMKLHPEDDSVMDDDDELKKYIKENELSPNLFTKETVWNVPRRLIPVLKEIIKQSVSFTTGQGVTMIFDLCKTLKLKAWFKKNFNKPVKIEDEDDCDFDDEMPEDDFDEVDKPEADEPMQDIEEEKVDE